MPSIIFSSEICDFSVIQNINILKQIISVLLKIIRIINTIYNFDVGNI